MKNAFRISGVLLVVLSIFLIHSCKKEKPQLPNIITIAVTEITQTSAIARGNITSDGGSFVKTRGVCWDTSANPSISLGTKTTDSTGTGIFESSITGLTAGTTYYVKAYATNSSGTSYGTVVSFTTNPATVPTLTTTAASNIGQTTASAGGNVTNDGNAPIIERGICYKTSQNPTVGNKKIVAGGTIGSFICNISDLSENTTYYIRAYAINSAGTAYGNEVIARGDIFACSGQGWSGASFYDPLKTGIHPIIYYSNSLLPPQWQAPSPGLVELVACESNTYTVFQTCFYTGGRIVTRYIIQVVVTIREAKTGNIVALTTFYSNTPDACPPTINTYSPFAIYGTINYTEINNWLQTYVVK